MTVKKVYLSPSTQQANLFVVGGITEEENSNWVTDILEKALRNKYGMTVYRNRPDMNLSEIIADSNAKSPDIHVSIHSNAGGGRGCEVYAYLISGRVTNSQKLAQYIYNEFSIITPSSDRGIKNGVVAKFGEVVKTTACAVLAEMAFHDNAEDAAWLIANRQACATAFEKGICSYFGITYIPDFVPPAMDYESLYKEAQSQITSLQSQLAAKNQELAAEKDKYNRLVTSIKELVL
jgi:N-acetylmuramoyl-L-alanine amidase